MLVRGLARRSKADGVMCLHSWKDRFGSVVWLTCPRSTDAQRGDLLFFFLFFFFQARAASSSLVTVCLKANAVPMVSEQGVMCQYVLDASSLEGLGGAERACLVFERVLGE